jgi:hypothetical protein
VTIPVFNQPGKVEPSKAVPMEGLAAEMAARYKELFYAWNNRDSTENRSAQKTLGPSEIGTPCDRRLVMSLLGAKPVNPGGDGWAAWMGTQMHTGLAEMFEWASADSGRFSVETSLQLPSALVPRGTRDLLDRVLFAVVDHKGMGDWSLKKLRSSGPSETYRIQAHLYGLGDSMRGERVRNVAIVGWPRTAATLDDLYVWTEPFSRKVGQDALKRVERLNKRALKRQEETSETVAEVGAQFDTADDCRYCPHFLRGSKSLEHGCNGKRDNGS